MKTLILELRTRDVFSRREDSTIFFTNNSFRHLKSLYIKYSLFMHSLFSSVRSQQIEVSFTLLINIQHTGGSCLYRRTKRHAYGSGY
jgi:hypothetical protein